MDWGWALVVAGASALLYGSTQQGWYYGDGSQLVDVLALAVDDGAWGQWIHLLYLPSAQILNAVVPGCCPARALELLSLSGGVGLVTFTFLLLGGLHVGRRAALATSALLLCSPVVWFFATTVEVHSWHAAMVAGCALATVRGPWRQPVLATVLSALLFPMVYLTHRSGILFGPGWLLLVQLARKRATGQAFTWRQLVFGVGGVHLVALLLAMVLVRTLQGDSEGLGITHTLAYIKQRFAGYQPGMLSEGLLWPLALLLPAGLVGAWRFRSERDETWLLLSVTIPLLLYFMLLFGDPTHGGYFLGLLPFICLPVARLFTTLPTWVLVVLVAVQAGIGVHRLQRPEAPELRRERAARLAAVRELLPDGGTVLSVDISGQSLNGRIPKVREYNLLLGLHETRGQDPTQVAEQILIRFTSNRRPLLLDMSFLAKLDRIPELERARVVFEQVVARQPAEELTWNDRRFVRMSRTR